MPNGKLTALATPAPALPHEKCYRNSVGNTVANIYWSSSQITIEGARLHIFNSLHVTVVNVKSMIDNNQSRKMLNDISCKAFFNI